MENITNNNGDDEFCEGFEQQAAGAVATMAHRAQEAVSAIGDKAKNVASTVASTASDVASSVSEKAGDVAGQLKTQANQCLRGALELGESMTNFIRRNPIPVLVVGIGIGFLIARSTARK